MTSTVCTSAFGSRSGTGATAFRRPPGPEALQPFQRLDQARGGSGHCGLGLAIAARVAMAHGGGLDIRRGEAAAGGFAVVLQARSLPDPSDPLPGAGPGPGSGSR